MDEIEKIQQELEAQFRINNISKDRVLIELLSEYRKVHPEPPAPPEPNNKAKKTKSKRKGSPSMDQLRVDRV
jgi:hypothetical protein